MDYTLNMKGQLMDLRQPRVMGILNATPDSFFADSRKQTEREIAARADEIVSQGATFIDVGAYSTRPGAERYRSRMRWSVCVWPLLWCVASSPTWCYL